MNQLDYFLNDESGATAIEYAIMASAIAAVIIIVVYAVGGKVLNSFNSVNDSWN